MGEGVKDLLIGVCLINELMSSNFARPCFIQNIPFLKLNYMSQCILLASAQRGCKCVIRYVCATKSGAGPMQVAALAHKWQRRGPVSHPHAS